MNDRQGMFFPTKLKRKPLLPVERRIQPCMRCIKGGTLLRIANKTLVKYGIGKGLVTSQDEKATATVVYMATKRNEQRSGHPYTALYDNYCLEKVKCEA